ncbi:HgcAB-associated protein HgcC [Chloroflexota bacterium]
MVQKDKEESCYAGEGETCCKVEAIVSVDQRGQMVLPKELRVRANICTGDKLAVTSWEKEGTVCCIILTKAEEFAEVVRATLGPVVQDIK